MSHDLLPFSLWLPYMKAVRPFTLLVMGSETGQIAAVAYKRIRSFIVRHDIPHHTPYDFTLHVTYSAIRDMKARQPRMMQRQLEQLEVNFADALNIANGTMKRHGRALR